MNDNGEYQNKSIKKTGWTTTPLSQQGVPGWIVYLMTLMGLIYILNPTLGVFELVPDNLPFVGNLDEGVAFLMLWSGLVEFFEGRRRRQVFPLARYTIEYVELAA